MWGAKAMLMDEQRECRWAEARQGQIPTLKRVTIMPVLLSMEGQPHTHHCRTQKTLWVSTTGTLHHSRLHEEKPKPGLCRRTHLKQTSTTGPHWTAGVQRAPLIISGSCLGNWAAKLSEGPWCAPGHSYRAPTGLEPCLHTASKGTIQSFTFTDCYRVRIPRTAQTHSSSNMGTFRLLFYSKLCALPASKKQMENTSLNVHPCDQSKRKAAPSSLKRLLEKIFSISCK